MVTCSADGTPERDRHLAGVLRRRDACRALVPVLQQDDPQRAREPARARHGARPRRPCQLGPASSSSNVRRPKARSSTRWTCRSRPSPRTPAWPASSSCGRPISIACCAWSTEVWIRLIRAVRAIRDGALTPRPSRRSGPSTDRRAAPARDYDRRARPQGSRVPGPAARVGACSTSTLDLEEIYDAALLAMDELFEFHHAIILLHQPGDRHPRGRGQPRLREPGGRRTRADRHRRHRPGRRSAGDAATSAISDSSAPTPRRNAAQMVDRGPERRTRRHRRRCRGLANAETPVRHSAAHARRAGRRLLDRERRSRRTFSEHERALVSDRRAIRSPSAIHNARLLTSARVPPTHCGKPTRRSRPGWRSGPPRCERELRVAEAHAERRAQPRRGSAARRERRGARAAGGDRARGRTPGAAASRRPSGLRERGGGARPA